jgi:hypothetical protein
VGVWWEVASQAGRRPGASVGFGIDAVLLSELVFPILTGAVGEVLGTTAVERIRSRRRPARPQAEPQVTPPEASTGTTGASKAGERPGEVVQLTGQQLHDLHDACRRHAMTLGVARHGVAAGRRRRGRLALRV